MPRPQSRSRDAETARATSPKGLEAFCQPRPVLSQGLRQSSSLLSCETKPIRPCLHALTKLSTGRKGIVTLGLARVAWLRPDAVRYEQSCAIEC
jgi:hypothetical protein